MKTIGKLNVILLILFSAISMSCENQDEILINDSSQNLEHTSLYAKNGVDPYKMSYILEKDSKEILRNAILELTELSKLAMTDPSIL
ncbi:MAG: hypothetical protein WBA16_08840 [Nonlabens sp.]